MHSVSSNAVAGDLNNYISNVLTTDGLIIKNIRYVAGVMPTASSQVTYINLPVLGNNEYIIILGGRVLRSSVEGYEYDIPTVGACLYETTNHRFYISVRQDFVPYVGGMPIGVLYAVIKLV